MTLNERCAMTLNELRALADEFFEWPIAHNKSTVTMTSALLFAQHVLQLHEKSLGAQNSASTPTLRDAAQQALDWLYGNDILHPTKVSQDLRAALEQAEPEPVAWQDTAKPTELVCAEHWENIDPVWHSMYRPLYTAPPQQAEPAQEPEPQTCTWQQDGDSGVYGTSCRRYFNLEDGTPEDNKMAWCCYCGKKLVQQAEPTGKDSLPVESVVAENATTQQQIEQTPPSDYRRGYWDGFNIGKREGRIEAEDELAQQAEPEPVAWRTFDGEGNWDYRTYDLNEHYAVRWAERNPRYAHWVEPLYAAPPQRKPLTDDEILEMVRAAPALGSAEDEWLHVARAIERAHGIGEEE